jgi:hypothetical protein
MHRQPGTKDDYGFCAMDEKYVGPQYPALSRVMLVESRFGVRADVVRALRASLMFEEIIEARSLSDGLMKLHEEEYDACIVGSSVSRGRARAFVDRAAVMSKTQDCAFIALVKDRDELVLLSADDSKFHATLAWPCSRRDFTQSLVLAVVSANADCSWAGILVPSDNELADVEDFEEYESAAEQPERRYSHSLTAFMNGEVTDLTSIVEGVRQGRFGLDEFRMPTPEVRRLLAEVVEKLFPPELQSSRIKKFRDYFRGALLLWYIDLVSYSAEIAKNNLRQSLLSFARDMQ